MQGLFYNAMTHAQTTTYAPISSASRDEILSINATLAETIAMASEDFLEMCNLLNKCNVKAENLKSEISAAVQELQHIDFLRQKLGHISDLYKELLRGEDATNIGMGEKIKSARALIFKINYYQLLAAHEDYIKVVLLVLSTIRKIKEHNVLLINFNAPIFPNRFQIDDNFRSLNLSLSSLADQYGSSSNADTALLVAQLSSMYTMESERVVLHWSTDAATSARSEEEFMDHYKANNFGNTIELF